MPRPRARGEPVSVHPGVRPVEGGMLVPGELVEFLASRFPSPGHDPGEDSPNPGRGNLLPHLECLVLQVLRGCCARHWSRVTSCATAASPQNDGGDTEDSKGTDANANNDPNSQCLACNHFSSGFQDRAPEVPGWVGLWVRKTGSCQGCHDGTLQVDWLRVARTAQQNKGHAVLVACRACGDEAGVCWF